MAARSRTLSLKELEERYASSDAVAPPGVLHRLRRDGRAGARRLYAKLQKRVERARRERERVERMLHFERVLWKAGIRRVAGVDEVGIGPMAGPVVAAAVVLPPEIWIEGIDDSKRLDPEAREEYDRRIRDVAVDIGIGVVDTDEVDRLNVYHAGLRAMVRAVETLGSSPDHVLVDSRTIPGLSIPQNGFDKGDGLNFSIACASIVAKVHRDRLMMVFDEQYPGYGFASHKGYCSPEHQEAVRRLGPCPIHRRSFDFIRELCGEYDARFYELRQGVAQARTRAELELWENRFRDERDALPPAERRKLRLMATRRWSRLTASSSPS